MTAHAMRAILLANATAATLAGRRSSKRVSHGMREALERVEEHGDLFEPVLAGGQALGRALKKLP